MATRPAKKKADPAKVLRWAIDCLELVRDSLCQKEKPRSMRMVLSSGPPYDVDCPPPPPVAPEKDLCQVLTDVIAALKTLERELAAAAKR